MSSQFQLRDGVYFVQGVLCGVLLDTNTGLTYSVNNQACKVLKYELADELYWLTLRNLGLAEQVDQVRVPQLFESPADEHLKFVWFEVVSDDCNERCIHCYAEAMPRKYKSPENQSGKNTITKRRMTHKDWQRAIKESYTLGCRACQFIGGEPLLYRGENGESVFDLLKFARQMGYTSIEVFTNATLLIPKQIQILKELEIKVAVSLYSHDPLVHDLITRTSGSHEKTVTSLQMLRESGVRTRVETPLMKANQDSIDDTIIFRKKMRHMGRRPHPIRPGGRGDNLMNMPDQQYLAKYGLLLKPNFVSSKTKIKHYKSGHSCLLGKLVITENGNILPCIFSRGQILGNFLDLDGFRMVMDSHLLHQIWHITKDDVLVCQDCEYRYVCFDCRPLAEGAAKGNAGYKEAPYPRCTYNPYTGEWGSGLWCVDKIGQPFYDRSMAAYIDQVKRFHETVNGY